MSEKKCRGRPKNIVLEEKEVEISWNDECYNKEPPLEWKIFSDYLKKRELLKKLI